MPHTAIIGAGSAGLMAAGRAGELGSNVILIEKNRQVGVKLLATGGGRCNITNKTDDPKLLASKFGKNGKFLLSAFNRFSPADVIKFFEDLGVKTKCEANNQLFPTSDKAQDILTALLNYLKKSDVTIKTNSSVKQIISSGKKITKIILENGEEIIADNYIIATGGKSYPATGSTGDAYKWLTELGHTIIPPRPALAPILLQEKFIPELEGLILSNINVNLYRQNKKIAGTAGDIIFTSTGISGPAIRNLSREISDAPHTDFHLELDLFPELTTTELDKKLQIICNNSGTKWLKTSLHELIVPKLIPTVIKLIGANPNQPANLTTKPQRQKLLQLLKNFSLNIKSVGDFDCAFITAGGVSLNEVDPKTMRSKIISNLFLAGEILDLDGPTGGFNLQMCWSTGFVAGESTTQTT